MRFLLIRLLFALLLCLPGLGLTAAQPRFVIFSPPKNGTFLSGKTLGLLTKSDPAYYLEAWELNNQELLDLVESEYASGRFVVSHHFTAEHLEMLAKQGYKILFILRDPRDQLVSITNWLREGQWQWMPASHIQDIDAQIEELIFGQFYNQRAFDIYFLSYEVRAKKVPSHALLPIRFENLVGEWGGGSKNAQEQEVIKMASFLHLPVRREEVDAVCSAIFGGTATFRSGQIGSWRDYFSERHKKLFKMLYNAHLIRLGYEKDGNW
jgi:hypothetical protein